MVWSYGGLVDPKYVFIGCAVLVAVSAFSLRGLAPREDEADDHAHIRDWYDFIVVFIGRACIVFGLTLLGTFVLYFFRDVLHVADPSRGTGFTGIAGLIGAVASSVVLGILSDRIRAVSQAHRRALRYSDDARRTRVRNRAL